MPSETGRTQAPGVLTVVGIGASAGGLEAFKNFFAAMPAQSGMAFVLIQHLDPTHESLTAEILNKQSKLPFVQVTNAMRVEPDHVYVIPPNKYLTIRSQTLHLTEPTEPRGVRVPVDFFFRSLAEEQQERAVGILLSGTGSDGTLGVREIKAAGGMVMVQSPETAQWDGMPLSAIATGVVDYVLPIEKMPDVLVRYVRHPYVNGAAETPPVADEAPTDLKAILGLLRARLKYDFTGYKAGTLTRRIQRRMGLKHIENLRDYLKLLRSNPDEINSLYKDLLINVTNFFREPEAWRALETQVVAPLVQSLNSEPAIRAWVPGCATGEEPYSLAMLLVEHCHRAERACDIQIFASDLDRDALEVARAGIYPENIAANMSPERLRQFFTNVGHTYRIDKEIRDMVVFAEQNAISDPPFSRLDLISCRNLLIYLEPEFQKQLFSLFHFALRQGGYLFLGSNESVGRQDDMFEAVSRKHRIYRRIGPTRHDLLQRALKPAGGIRVAHPRAPERDKWRKGRVGSLSERLILQRFAPACAVVNRKGEVLHLAGPVDRYLQLPSGELGSDLIAMAREGLQTSLRSALHEAIRDGRAVTVEADLASRGRKPSAIQIVAEPLRQPQEADGLLLVTFLEVGKSPRPRAAIPPAAQGKPRQSAAGKQEHVVRNLEEQLRGSQDDLQRTVEELESANEEFRVANEEVTSINEELQSTNEELETSKEELQSLNEELHTVNSQLEQKVGELEAANNDLHNLLASTDVAIVFLDRRFCLKRFTPATTRLFRVIASDVFRPIGDITRNFSDDRMLQDAEAVLEKLTPAEAEVQDTQGRWYARKIVPYRTDDNRIDGVVLTFVDITARKQHEQALLAMKEQLELQAGETRAQLSAILQTSPAAIVTASLEGVIQSWNKGAEDLYGYSGREAIGRKLQGLSPSDHSEDFARILGKLRLGEKVQEYETVRLHKDGTRIDVALTASLIRGSGGKECGVCSIGRDIRERKLLELQIGDLANKERQHIGQELHDTLGQEITAVGMLAATLKGQLADNPKTVELAEKLESSTQRAKAQLRSLTKGLFPVDVDALGLRVALEGLAHDTESIYNVPCRFECPKEVLVEDNFTATQLFLIAREAAQNAAKHAKAKVIVIGLAGDGHVRVFVQDDGVGMPADLHDKTGMGLRIMRHRCALVGGELTIDKAPGGGTLVACQLRGIQRETT